MLAIAAEPSVNCIAMDVEIVERLDDLGSEPVGGDGPARERGEKRADGEHDDEQRRHRHRRKAAHDAKGAQPERGASREAQIPEKSAGIRAPTGEPSSILCVKRPPFASTAPVCSRRRARRRRILHGLG